MDPLLTTDEVAAFFQVDVVTIRRMISKREITAYRIGGEYRFKQADIEAYLERQQLLAHDESRGHLGKLTGSIRQLVISGASSASDRLSKGAFDRFTDRAADALLLAQDEARHLQHHYLGTEHILLGLLREEDSVAAEALATLGLELSRVRSAVEAAVGLGEREVTGEIGLTARAKKVLELAVDEARKLEHHYVGTEHLLLALLREGEGAAAKVLRDFGLTLNAIRDSVQGILARRAEQ